MSIFDIFTGKKKQKTQEEVIKTAEIYAPVSGNIVPMKEIPDQAFAQGAIGWCCGIDPVNNILKAPIDGQILQLADTYHALGIQGDNGARVILHIGMDTVDLKGQGFKSFVRGDDRVKIGQSLIEFDLDFIKSHNLNPMVIVAVINSDEFGVQEMKANDFVNVGDMLMYVKTK